MGHSVSIREGDLFGDFDCGSELEGFWRRRLDARFWFSEIVLVGRGQRLSNKGIATEAANRALLYELVKGQRAAIFEEAHLGIRETGSIVGLARHYHLQGLMAGFRF